MIFIYVIYKLSRYINNKYHIKRHYCPGEGLIYECTEPLEACEGGCVDECYICPGGS